MYKTLNLSKDIKLIVSDFDGIFTDNSVYLLNEDVKLKKLSFKDLMGVAVAVRNGIKVAIISGEHSKEIDYVAEKFSLEDIHQGIRIKCPLLKALKEKYNLNDEEILYVGDDINDIECLNSVKYAITVEDANYKVKELPHIQITKANAGNGAFREIVDNIISLREAKNEEQNI